MFELILAFYPNTSDDFRHWTQQLAQPQGVQQPLNNVM